MKKILLLLSVLICLHLHGYAQPDGNDTATAATQQAVNSELKKDKQAINDTEGNVAAGEDDASTVSVRKTRFTKVDDGHYRARNGMGWVLIWIMILLIVAVIIILLSSLKKGGFELKDALSENIRDKIVKENPEYSADKIKQWIIDTSSATLTFLNTQISLAEDKLKTLQAASTPDADAITAAEAALATARDNYETAIKAGAGSGAMSTAMLSSVANLFPPTIEVTGATASYRPSVSRIIALLSSLLLLIVGLGSSCFFIYFYLVTQNAPNLGKLSAVLIALGIGIVPYSVNKISSSSGK